ncbi:PTS-dependent dihydroxyacetone kinase phosphotransferase subunit DhaM [Salicibibacter cibarius]|uniref:phosphoenolpyruvate--glycerone phosphotransferase n=1 Tax=Salicibibacter cibarius TaxID=2743000 RepID=A0A7T6Z6K1_9BACI|nr:dihydroxyacetone kinase phosphoryl donor subunit DhaM [Salicibibacter cibarius]QQK77938.1 PTS-dependent dihydroxyacetone kinase phosphotransferase subunit DhaM [Salicibibacter cibarius]
MAGNQVAILLISHVETLAEGARELLQQANPEVGVYACGGLDGGEIGTSVDRIEAIVKEIDPEDAILIFYDIGSAKMNAEMVQEMYEGRNIAICNAPLIEGGYVATVTAGLGTSSLAKVKREAEEGYSKEG